MDQRYGEDIYITDGQKRVVISEKNSIVELGTSEYLLDNKLVRIGKHSLKRILQRVGSDSFETLITIIDRIKIMNHVHKAQWKGYPQLSYTLKLENDPNRFKISISFEPSEIENHTLKVITVSNVRSSDFSSIPKENMEQRINENPILVEKMEKIKERLKKL
ncbi:hypothetical protein [Ureibacillus thermosphaericus]|uniref:hypothetical protein n=1 Tax=Ureibacillus thermosphaericus TaxID=51173 RepID=UPI000BBC17A2|nr:hypothetical protein [Ureibacillus thermosphaericus]